MPSGRTGTGPMNINVETSGSPLNKHAQDLTAMLMQQPEDIKQIAENADDLIKVLSQLKETLVGNKDKTP